MRLFIIMGVSWIMEAIVYLAEDPHNKDTNMFVIIMDVWNLLQGLVIFILFVMKRRVLNLIKKRFALKQILYKILFCSLNHLLKFIPFKKSSILFYTTFTIFK